MDVLAGFHPAVRAWFERRFPEGPTEPQAAAWPSIAAGQDTLIAAPTGSGKTLAAFLGHIDRLYRESLECELPEATDVVYVSPLKALASDIHANLEVPLQEIRAVADELGYKAPELRSVVRSGDTPSSARAAMLKRPPHFLITTPESLYLLVTAERSREILRRVRSVIVDEIHAVAGDKRGSHLALTLERLAQLCEGPLKRIGLSATQKPVESIAELLVGRSAQGSRECTIVDLGHRRALDLAIEVPESELEAVTSHEQWGEILDRIAELVGQHKTTLVFVNTRRLAERLAHLLSERLDEDQVAAHHGSLSKERRLRVENRLRAGELRVLVATASLELGIDIGPVELVCQIGSPRRLATFLQRVGRSGHARSATPRGRLFPTTRDELVECAALMRGVCAGRLDRVLMPSLPLDILAQQLVAACAAETWNEDELYAMVRRAQPFASLDREDFDAVVAMLSDGVVTGRGRRGAYLHRDRVNGTLRARRGARIVALTSGGAIPDTADYRVVADPDDTFVGTVNEDWAIESQAGDIFLLGTTSWQIRRVEAGVVRVTDAHGAPPSVPFWLGEAPARSAELSQEVSDLRRQVEKCLAANDREAALAWLQAECALDAAGADQIVRYLAAARQALGVIPSQQDVVFERFFDETGGMQLVIHAPFGGRVNRAFGLALRKRFCRSFDFELQAAASDDAVVLSLGPQHSFPLDQVPRFLSADAVADTLAQAMLASPMFTARWRWNLGRALLILRQRGSRKVPPPIQRMEADDLMAAMFPSLAACQENVSGPIEIPDHPLVRQTIHDCLTDASDVDGLASLLRDIHEHRVETHFCDTTEPSPFSHEILNGRPYTFLDDAPLEERRTRAVALRRGLPDSERDFGHLDAEAVERVREEARPEPRDVDELHDVLVSHGLLQPVPRWWNWFDELVRSGRAARAETPQGWLWFATESLRVVEALLGAPRIKPQVQLPASLARDPAPDEDTAAAQVLRGHLDARGPSTATELVEATGLTASLVERGLARLELEGFALRGSFDPARSGDKVEEWCARRLLARIHRYTHERLRREIEPVTAQDFMRFLLRWQHLTPHTKREGRRGVLAVVEQLQGFELAAGSWEEQILPSRVTGYQREWLDALCLSGEVVWGRSSPRALTEDPLEQDAGRGGLVPSRATPITFALRDDWPWLLTSARGDNVPRLPGPGAAQDVLEALRQRGALFFSELVTTTGRLPIEVEQGLWDLVSRGLVSADGFESVRRLLDARHAARRTQRRARRGLRRGATGRVGAEGRWAPLPSAALDVERDELALATAEQLLARWGVVFRDLLVRESLSLPWRELLYALRRMEARGVIRGGRFVTGFVGEQFALPGALDALRRVRRLERNGEEVRISGVDPLNLVGVLTPGPRVPALRTQTIVYRDGLPAKAESAA